MAPWSSRMRSAERPHLCDVEVVDLDRDADPTERRDHFRCLLDGFRAVVIGVGVTGDTAATRTDHRGTRLAERRAIPRPAPRVAPATSAMRLRRASPSGVSS